MKKLFKNEYGSYEIPKEVLELIQLEKELNEKGESLETIGFMPILHEFSYSITPPDLIPFAHTGGNGIHFGFLTDFGQVKNLNDAPIVCVAPTYDPPICYIARNLKEFLNLASSVSHVEMLQNYWPWKDAPSIKEINAEFNSYATPEWIRKREMHAQLFQAMFNTKPLDVHKYVQEVLEERNQKITIPTYDGLGIIGTQSGIRYVFKEDRKKDEKEILGMQDYLKNASFEEKLAFIRDTSYWYVLDPDYAGEVLKLWIELIKSLGLYNEIKRVMYRM